MVTSFSRARASLAAAAICAFLAPAAHSPMAFAADMPFFTPSPEPVNDEPVEFGTGWYLRGDVGYANVRAPVIIADLIAANPRTGSVAGSLGAGYQYNPWLRTEVAIDFSAFRPAATGAAIWCPYSAHPLTSPGDPLAVPPIPPTNLGGGQDLNETCTPRTTANLYRTSGFFNGYVDLGNWSGFTPYVGAGVGISYLKTDGALNYYKNSDGSPYSADLSTGMNGYPLIWVNKFNGAPVLPQPLIPFALVNWNRSISKSSWKFAWNLMAGVSYDVAQHLKIDVGYRFMSAGTYTSLPGNAGSAPIARDLLSHEIRVGLRMTAD